MQVMSQYGNMIKTLWSLCGKFPCKCAIVLRHENSEQELWEEKHSL